MDTQGPKAQCPPRELQYLRIARSLALNRAVFSWSRVVLTIDMLPAGTSKRRHLVCLSFDFDCVSLPMARKQTTPTPISQVTDVARTCRGDLIVTG